MTGGRGGLASAYQRARPRPLYRRTPLAAQLIGHSAPAALDVRWRQASAKNRGTPEVVR